MAASWPRHGVPSERRLADGAVVCLVVLILLFTLPLHLRLLFRRLVPVWLVWPLLGGRARPSCGFVLAFRARRREQPGEVPSGRRRLSEHGAKVALSGRPRRERPARRTEELSRRSLGLRRPGRGFAGNLAHWLGQVRLRASARRRGWGSVVVRWPRVARLTHALSSVAVQRVSLVPPWRVQLLSWSWWCCRWHCRCRCWWRRCRSLSWCCCCWSLSWRWRWCCCWSLSWSPSSWARSLGPATCCRGCVLAAVALVAAVLSALARSSLNLPLRFQSPSNNTFFLRY